MMDKAYILKHGILEQYLLGELNIDDQLIIEQLLSEDTELKSLFENLEANFETMAFENAIIPPTVVKDNLMASVKSIQTKVIPINKGNAVKTYFSIAASVAAILLIGGIWLFNQLNKTKQQLQIVEEQKSLLLKDIDNLSENLELSSKWLNILNSPDTEQYILLGNDLSPKAKIVSYVNHKNKSVVINTKNLPKLDDKHDYQMWADVEGEMINMGVIDKQKQLLAMNYIDNAESLNITIESIGGSDHPTVSNLITNVYLR
jgi:anti-sigma-K factor RskA